MPPLSTTFAISRKGVCAVSENPEQSAHHGFDISQETAHFAELDNLEIDLPMQRIARHKVEQCLDIP